MRLYNSKYDFSIELIENQAYNIVIENATALSSVMESLYGQINGMEGDFILSEAEQILPLPKNIVLISNPFEINCNDKKILNKLYQELQTNMQEQAFDFFNDLNCNIINFLDLVINTVPYNLESSFESDFIGLLKLYDVKICVNADSLLEKIIDYIRAIKNICGIQVIAFLNLKQFLTVEELQQLYEFCFYEKVHIIIIGGVQTKLLPVEKSLIIDKDLCKICI